MDSIKTASSNDNNKEQAPNPSASEVREVAEAWEEEEDQREEVDKKKMGKEVSSNSQIYICCVCVFRGRAPYNLIHGYKLYNTCTGAGGETQRSGAEEDV